MSNVETLRNARNQLLKLHKTLVDSERRSYENIHGSQTSGQFLNVLIEDEGLAWLRRFSMLIVEIDEMFDLKDGQTAQMVDASLDKVIQLVGMKGEDDDFRTKYQEAVQTNVDVAAQHSELKGLLAVG